MSQKTQQRTSGLRDEPLEKQSLGELVTRATQDAAELMRKEVQLAKAELREEASQASKAGAKLGSAALAGYLALLLASFAAAWGLTAVIAVGWSFLIMAVFYALVASALYTSGRKQLRKINPKPQQTVETLKEDAKWAKAQAR